MDKELLQLPSHSERQGSSRSDTDAFGFYCSNHGQLFQLLENDGIHEKIDRLLGMVEKQGNMIDALQMEHQNHVSSIAEVSKVLESLKKDVDALKTRCTCSFQRT